MSLYDDLDTRQRADKVAGWSSGIKLLQSQLQLKKATTTQPKRESMRKASKVLAPVIDLKSRRDDEDIYPRLIEPARPKVPPPQRSPPHMVPHIPTLITQQPPQISQLAIEYDLIIEDEYNPLFPNEYEKVVKELRDIRDRESDYRHEERDRGDRGDTRSDRGDRNDRDRGERENRDNNRDRKKDRKSRKSRFEENVEPSTPRTGFSGSAEEQSPPRRERDMSNRSAGAAIAPPPSLVETQSSQRPTSPSNGPSQGNSERSYNMPYGASSVAAKIMAKYGFKEGQGLGKSQQGMSVALQVEKTSKRGGRIIHEKEIPIPQPLVPLVASYDMGDMDNSPPQDEDVSSDPMGMMGPPPLPKSAPEPTITEIMKSPSKVVLLRNMVGPGDVDQDLEPEVKDECNTKYGDVTRVLIHELPGAVPEEAVRIFVEFKRIESAIKAVVDLNGRFFGGRQVRAGFYNVESFANLKLLE